MLPALHRIFLRLYTTISEHLSLSLSHALRCWAITLLLWPFRFGYILIILKFPVWPSEQVQNTHRHRHNCAGSKRSCLSFFSNRNTVTVSVRSISDLYGQPYSHEICILQTLQQPDALHMPFILQRNKLWWVLAGAVHVTRCSSPSYHPTCYTLHEQVLRLLLKHCNSNRTCCRICRCEV